MSRKILTGLLANEYEHPLDRKALKALKSTPGVDTLGKLIFKYGIEKITRTQYTGNSIKVTQESFPDLFMLFEEACCILDLPYKPDFYIYLDYAINAMTIGAEHPIVVFSSGAIDNLGESELMYVLGHELGHIKSGHCMYHMMANALPIIGDVIGTFTLGLGDLVAQGIQLALLTWQRKSELTADRAGLLVAQESQAVVGALMKISGVPKRYYGKVLLSNFINQAREFEDMDTDNLSNIAKKYCIMTATHPWSVVRASEIIKWIESNEVTQILDNH